MLGRGPKIMYSSLGYYALASRTAEDLQVMSYFCYLLLLCCRAPGYVPIEKCFEVEFSVSTIKVHGSQPYGINYRGGSSVIYSVFSSPVGKIGYPSHQLRKEFMHPESISVCRRCSPPSGVVRSHLSTNGNDPACLVRITELHAYTPLLYKLQL